MRAKAVSGHEEEDSVRKGPDGAAQELLRRLDGGDRMAGKMETAEFAADLNTNILKSVWRRQWVTRNSSKTR